jgi:hypothetical protein
MLADMKKIEMVGKKYNMLTVMLDVGYSHGQQSYLCSCDCGNKLVIAGQRIRNGQSKSCGCLARKQTSQRHKTHGLSKTPEYRAWAKIKMRCTNPNDPNFYRYGGRGVGMCDEWYNSFEQFYKDLGKRPNGMSLDRIDNNQGYSKDNCRWATPQQQAANRELSIVIDYDGKSMCLKEWSRHINRPYTTMLSHYKKGYSINQILRK